MEIKAISKQHACGAFEAITEVELKQYRELTDARIREIRATPNMELPAGADCRYLSAAHGDDSFDGKTPATAWKTLPRLDAETLAAGSYVLFERGGVYRGGFNAKAGVTYTAYGTGEKPKIYSSPENGADPAKWERTDVPNVWSYQLDGRDVGTLVFDDGAAHAIKVMPRYLPDGTYSQVTNGKPFNRGYRDLSEDLHFWHDYSAETKFQPFAQGSGKLYLVSETNPGERFHSIEFNVKKHGIAVGGQNNVTIDNLCIMYVGSHGVGAGTVKGLKVTNCEFGWIGGSIQAEGIFGRAHATRYGNAVEIYGGCDDYCVCNCYIYQVYDAGITQQFGIPESNPIIMQKHMRYADNVIENCNYSIEYFLSGAQRAGNSSRMEDFVIENNLMWNAARGFCHQRPDPTQGAHIKSWRNHSNRATGYIIRNNLFACSDEMLMEVSSDLLNPDGTDSMPRLEGNVFIGRKDQRFGVLNQGTPNELRYNDAVAKGLEGRGGDSRFLFV